MVLIIVGLPIMLIVASIVSAGLATDTIGLSNFDKCGRYKSVESNSSIGSLEYEHKAEAEANVYATDCYGSSPLVNSCNRFYNQSIGYAVSTVECPFKGKVCDTPQNGSVRLSTGLVSGSVLGINSKNQYYFGRTMTCSPLVSGDEYVRVGLSEQGEKQWEYWYGPSLGAYTSANPVQESSWEIKGYSTRFAASRIPLAVTILIVVSVHWSDPKADTSPYQPLNEFTAGYYPVTLTFISSHTIFYPSIRDDVVFPAHTKAQFSDGYPGPDLYYNNSTRAGVLGCVDQYQICESMNGRCWDNSNITSLLNEQSAKGSSKSQYVTWLILIALKYSTSPGSIQFRGSEALDAQAKIAHMLSLPLAEKQWQVEAEKMFRTSLARMQLNLYDFVRGTAANYEGYENTLPVEHRAMCQMVTIPTVGWRNINFIGLLGTIFAVGIVWGIQKQKDASGNEVFLVISMSRWITKSSVLVWRGMLVPGIVALGLIVVRILKYLRGVLLALVS
ncbi:hypothetical protein BDZ45DRAFT_371177 [Acephala macrosclerotiorum]|nr:hypothetical protein BDZ45DRAFT_371177 [Acephala macrosclerotiorum]